MSLSNWMSRITNNPRLCDLVLPGSHDAGIYKVTGLSKACKVGGKEKVKTQKKTILEQLEEGVRCLDIRVYRKKTKNGIPILYTGHFSETFTRGKSQIGGYGAPFLEVLNDIKTFLNRNNSETVILRLSHIHEDNIKWVALFTGFVLQNKLYLINDSQTIGLKRLNSLRGKVIIIYENRSEKYLKTITETDLGPFYELLLHHIFPDFKKSLIYFINYKKEKMWDRIPAYEKAKKLVLRGEYSNEKYYTEIVKKQKAYLEEWAKLKRKYKTIMKGEMMQLYWTSTGIHNIENDTNRLWGDGMNTLYKLVHEFKPNIVWMDFCEEDKCKWILEAAR